jgi:hypothetical protein
MHVSIAIDPSEFLIKLHREISAIQSVSSEFPLSLSVILEVVKQNRTSNIDYKFLGVDL